MKKLLESYFDYLSSNPGEFTSVNLWLITNVIIYAVLLAYRKKMVHGAAGQNGFMESPEQVMYILNWAWPSILTYAAFFRAEYSVWVWGFMIGCIAWALGGRWLFDWALAFKSGATRVTESKTEVKAEVKSEVKQETA